MTHGIGLLHACSKAVEILVFVFSSSFESEPSSWRHDALVTQDVMLLRSPSHSSCSKRVRARQEMPYQLHAKLRRSYAPSPLTVAVLLLALLVLLSLAWPGADRGGPARGGGGGDPGQLLDDEAVRARVQVGAQTGNADLGARADPGAASGAAGEGRGAAAARSASASSDMGTAGSKSFGPPVVMGSEALMAKKGHGSCSRGVQESLRWNVDQAKADKICCFNRHYAEYSSYFTANEVTWLKEVPRDAPTEYYDSVFGKLCFTAPKGRSFAEFLAESRSHGWPSFRDEETNWDVVRVLPGGEAVTVDGVHLGHNIPDSKGNRYCINLVCVAGSPAAAEDSAREVSPDSAQDA